ncbi:P-loop NTPase family protein [Hydrocoleum sp. CS-953]|uniref:P-loop NTPase family protein n=1 Tax=Microcoleaceae TaxID=1892252 RepID=UPI000B9C2EDA|nr:P-loop NTPase family protein [Hydrocoleum sp. CS-953]OZH53452.1 cob(I)yrinic acid a,c-diamide adenosyltransferase [Hydrocoleum sp. CS-953]
MVAQLQTPALNVASDLPYTIPGLVQVFTSGQRNFFTDVMAQALRIAGQGTSVLIVQFLKGGLKQGHDKPTQLGQNLDWVRCGVPGCIDTSDIDESQKNSLLDLWGYTQAVVAEGRYELVVLDELSLAVNFGLIPESEVLDFLEKRPYNLDVILTGPNMPEEILQMADQITEIRRSHRP